MRSISTRFTGLLLVALGAWGGLVPFVGHYFHFAMGPDKAWSWTTGRLYLSILPGVVTILGGLNLMSAGPRRSARLGALLALAGGIWFTIGPEISQLWHAGGAQGAGHGSARIQMLEMLTYHTGLGVVIASLAAYALPRFPALEKVAASAGAGAMAARHDRGAYDDRRDREDVRDEEFDREGGTHRHHLGRDAAIGAGVAGAAAAEHHHREHEAEREQAAGEPVDERAPAPDEAGTRQHHLGRDAAIVAGAAAAEHHHREHEAEREEAVEPEDTAGATAATGTPTQRAAGYPGHSTVRRRRGGLLGNLLHR